MDPLLLVDELSMNFGGVQALYQVGFEVRPGQVTAVIGPNGAGKTTAINCISGVYRPQQGSIRFAGQQLIGCPNHRLAHLGLTRTFQNLQVFGEMTVLENVMLGLHGVTRHDFLAALLRLPGFASQERRIRERARGMLQLVGLEELALSPAGQLAYGDQKRVELARAMVSQPKLVLLDEPAAGLNPAETEQMAELIQAIVREGGAVILVEHDMDLVMGLSDWVVVLHYGCKIAEGTPAQVQAHPEVIGAYLGGRAGAWTHA